LALRKKVFLIRCPSHPPLIGACQATPASQSQTARAVAFVRLICSNTLACRSDELLSRVIRRQPPLGLRYRTVD
jgi:hypothetical protein